MPQPNPSERPSTFPKRPNLGTCLAAIRRPELYRNFAVHLFVMLPAAIVMAWIGRRMDLALELQPLLAWPLGAALGGAMIGTGAFWVWYVYGYLYLSGRGSPGSHVDGGPTWLVDTGPYAVVRHPSVLGKLLGVLGLGVIFGSVVFVLGIVPLLVVYSLLTNRFLQERYCDQRFGPAYEAYRQRVPMLLPRPSGILRWLRDESVLDEGHPRAHGPSPRGAWLELRWYLVGLVALISGFWLLSLTLRWMIG